MPVPTPRCVVCDTKMTNWTSQRGQHPKYCSDECQTLGKANPHCGRCKKPMILSHYSQRYHEECAQGCKVCGKPLREKTKSKKPTVKYRATTAGHLQPIYCSEGCQEYAWAGDPLPICHICKEPVPLPKPPQSLRNPPRMHRMCNRQLRRAQAEKEEELRRQQAAKLATKQANQTAKARSQKVKELTPPARVPLPPTPGTKTPRKDTRIAPWDED